MAWFIIVVLLVISAILIILFLNRYYRKATREISVVRTGQGGQKVVLDGGCLALPFLHKVAEVNMRTSKLDIERTGSKSIITKDRLRVDVAAEFYVRVQATTEGVATAAQALAGKSFRSADLEEILEGKVLTLHNNRFAWSGKLVVDMTHNDLHERACFLLVVREHQWDDALHRVCCEAGEEGHHDVLLTWCRFLVEVEVREIIAAVLIPHY